MFCPECGTSLNDFTKFCPNCGTPTGAAAQAANQPAADSTVPVAQPTMPAGDPTTPGQTLPMGSPYAAAAQNAPAGAPTQAQPPMAAPLPADGGQPGGMPPAPAPGGDEPKKGPSRNLVIIIAIIAAVVVIGIIVAALSCSSNGSQEPSSNNSEAAASSSAAEPEPTESSSGTGVSLGSSSSSQNPSPSASSSSSAPSYSSSSSSSPTPQAGMQTIGNRATGTMQVPSSWRDETSSYDPNIVDSTEMVYYVDPDSEYTSGALGHYSFARTVQMRVYPTSYSDILQQVVSSYDDSLYGDVDYQEDVFNGLKCYVVVTDIPEDNLYIANLIVDRDGDGKCTVLFTITGTEGTIPDVLGYVGSWQPPR